MNLEVAGRGAGAHHRPHQDSSWSPPCGGRTSRSSVARFPDACHLYTPALREELARRRPAKELDMALREGVYMYFPGPQYETPAEVRAARILGGDAVGMSTAPEVITAGHCGMEVLGFTLLSNMAAGILRPAPQRAGGAGCRRGRPGQVLPPGAGLPESKPELREGDAPPGC